MRTSLPGPFSLWLSSSSSSHSAEYIPEVFLNRWVLVFSKDLLSRAEWDSNLIKEKRTCQLDLTFFSVASWASGAAPPPSTWMCVSVIGNACCSNRVEKNKVKFFLRKFQEAASSSATGNAALQRPTADAVVKPNGFCNLLIFSHPKMLKKPQIERQNFNKQLHLKIPRIVSKSSQTEKVR